MSAAEQLLTEREYREQRLSELDPYFLDVVRRLRSSVRFNESIRQSADWLTANTADPRDENKPFSFKDHEYQIDICNDDNAEQVIQKPSQVGASELASRRVLAMMGLLSGVTAIYTMPSSKPAKKFCKERIDTVIGHSRALKSVLNRDVDNTEMKQFGNNFLHISGTWGSVNAISVPTTILVKDEINFSDSVVLGKFKSRMTHNKEGEAIDISFSTPTDPGTGVSEKFELSDKKYYHVKHDGCGQWVKLSYAEDCVVIPGYNDVQLKGEDRKTVLDLEASDIENPEYDIDGAWYRCPCCGEEVTHANLSDPTKRQWIATAKSKVSGYQIFPHDVPAYNNLQKILYSLGGVTGYPTKADWVNFCLGLPYSDTSTKFNVSLLDHLSGKQLEPKEGCGSGLYAGLDVGKTSWFIVGEKKGAKLLPVYAEKIVNSEDGDYLHERVNYLRRVFGIVRMVVDTAPDITAFRKIRNDSPEGVTYGCQYVRSRGKMVSNFEADEEEQIVNAYRTGVFNELCQEFNAGIIEFTNLKELTTIRDHLDVMTRITVYNEEGEGTQRWINKRKPDHYAHALNYMRLASCLDELITPSVAPVSVVSFKKAKMKVSTPKSSLLN